MSLIEQEISFLEDNIAVVEDDEFLNMLSPSVEFQTIQ